MLKSQKKGNRINTNDGRLCFEEILFESQYKNITLNDVLVILTGEFFDSLEESSKKSKKSI